MRRSMLPEGLEIIPRRLKLALSAATPKYWLNGHPDIANVYTRRVGPAPLARWADSEESGGTISAST